MSPELIPDSIEQIQTAQAQQVPMFMHFKPLFILSIVLTAGFAAAVNLWFPAVLQSLPYYINTMIYFGLGELLSQSFSPSKKGQQKFDAKKIAIAIFLYGFVFGIAWNQFYLSYKVFIPNTFQIGKCFRVFVDQAAGATMSILWTFFVSGFYDKLSGQLYQGNASIWAKLRTTAVETWQERKGNFLRLMLFCWLIWIPIQYFNLNSSVGSEEMVSNISVIEMPWSIIWVLLANLEYSKRNYGILPGTVVGFGMGTFIGYFGFYIGFLHSILGIASASWLIAVPLFGLLGAVISNLRFRKVTPA